MLRPHFYLSLFALLWVFSGWAEPHAAAHGEFVTPIGLVHAFVGALLLFFWCKAHAASRGIEAPAWSAYLVFLIAFVGVPLYFFRTMPWKDAVIATLKSAAFCLLCMSLYAAALRMSLHFSA